MGSLSSVPLRPLSAAAAGLLAAGALAHGLPSDDGEPAAAVTETRAHAPRASFSDLFRAEDAVRLTRWSGEKPVDLRSMAAGRDGRLAAVGRGDGSVLVYGRDGELQGRISASPEGAVRAAVDAAFLPDGKLAVLDAGARRVALYDASLSLDTVFPLQGSGRPLSLEAIGSRLVVARRGREPSSAYLQLYGRDGRLVRSFGRTPPENRRVPYWSAVHAPVTAATGDRVMVSSNLRYPFRGYSLEDPAEKFSVGTPPPDWRPASRPERGAFSGPGRFAQFAKWRRSFTTLDALVSYRDSLLVAVHERLDPEILAREIACHEADIYGPHGEKLARQVSLPGRVLAGGRHLHVLTGRSPDGWTVTRFRLTGALEEGG